MTAIITSPTSELTPFFQRAIQSVRDDVADNPYLIEAFRVLPVGGLRSAIGSFWNAVVDDLRNKIMHRSLDLFNKAVNCGRSISKYEDFQNYINDDQLIEGAYSIGVIGWEASKLLKHAKETRHIFDGHPRSTEPSVLKVLAMFDDCVKYVLSVPYPPQIIDINDYLTQLGSDTYDRNDVAIENALSELPDVYKVELINRLFSAYVHPDASTLLRGNIEFASPILWNVLAKDVKVQVVRRVDQEITAGNADRTSNAFAFITVVKGSRYLTTTARKYRIKPILKRLEENLDKWKIEDECVLALEPFSAYMPDELLPDYIKLLTLVYVGTIGSSMRYSRTDFYAELSAIRIPVMLQRVDDKAASAFTTTLRSNPQLRRRIVSPVKLNRLRALGNIVLERVSDTFVDRPLLEALVDPAREEEFVSSFVSP